MKKTLNFVGMVIVAVGPSYGFTFFGYLLNAASWGFWPVLYVGIHISQVFRFSYYKATNIQIGLGYRDSA